MEPRTFADVVHALAGDDRPGHTHISRKGSRILTFDEVRQGALVSAAGLQARGLAPGDRFGLIHSDPATFNSVFLGALLMGAIPVPLSPPIGLGALDAYAQRTAGLLRASGARLLITTANLRKLLYHLIEDIDPLEDIVDGRLLEDPNPVDITYRPQPADVAFLQYTSGSTAAPKGVAVTHANLVANASAIMVDGLRYVDGDKGYTWLPLYHDMGLIGFLLSPLLVRCPVVFQPTLQFLRDPRSWLEGMSAHSATITFAPNFAYGLTAAKVDPDALDLSAVRVWGCGAEPIIPETIASFIERFAPAGMNPEAFFSCYGLAEATLAVTFSRPGVGLATEHIAREPWTTEGRAEPAGSEGFTFVSCGSALAEHEVEVVDQHGELVADRQIGQIRVRGPSVAAGYYADDSATAAAFTPAGLLTGDLGYMVGGRLYVTGRSKDTVILRGHNYDPHTLEQAATVEGVRKGCVVAFSRHGPGGEELVIAAEARPEVDRAPLASAIERAVAARVGARVADVVLLDRGTLPKTTSGKLQRNRTKSAYLDGTLSSAATSDDVAVLSAARHYARSLRGRVLQRVRGTEGGD